MSRGKDKSRPTLGDNAPNLMSQWLATKGRQAPTSKEAVDGGSEAKRESSLEQTLRSWKKGADPVRVVKGTATGFDSRRKKAADVPARARHATSAPTFPAEIPPRPAPPPLPRLPVKSLRQRLSEASADLRTLRIAAAMSRPRHYPMLAPVVENTQGRLAVLGLDFGTAFTKAVVRWSGRHHAVDWSGAIEGDDPYLLASVFSEAQNGTCELGARVEPGWRVLEDIKLRLLSYGATSSAEHRSNAVIFIALAFRYAARWLSEADSEARSGVRWRLHVGLPTKSWDDDSTTQTFKEIAQAARILATTPGPVTRNGALDALSRTDQVDRPAVDVLPEFACQLYSYLKSPERAGDLHALVDIGAGTLDVAYFNVFARHGETLLPIFSSEVERLGAHYLVAALSGPAGLSSWKDGEAALSDDEVGQKLQSSPKEVGSRRSLYLSAVADVFNSATREAIRVYPTAPAIRGEESVRLFLCGGGSRIDSIRRRFEVIARDAPTTLRIRFQVSELVRPRDIVGKVGGGFDRLSVAYGLSHLAENVGSVMRTAGLEPLSPRQRLVEAHRDDNR